jgi:hypothetical protein
MMHSSILFILIVVVAFLVVFRHDKEGFLPLVIGGAYAYNKSGATWSKGPRPENLVSVFKDGNFEGYRRDYTLGTVQNSLSKGRLGSGWQKENDTYSSAIVPAGLELVLYEHENLQGRSLTLKAGSYASFPNNFNDMTSSLKVVAAGTTNEAAVKMFEHKDYKGKALNMYGPSSTADMRTPGAGIDSRDNMVTSMLVSPGYKVTFYAEPNYQGESGVFTAGSYPYIGGYWNDRISSFKVEAA